MLVGISSDDLARLQREMRAIDKDFSNAMSKELRDAVSPMTAQLKLSARVNAPGFLSGADVASNVSQSVSFKGVSVRRRRNSRFTQGGNLDAGRVRHPLFGNRGYWFDTATPESTGWWSKVAEDEEPEAAERLVAAMWEIVSRLRSGNLSTVKVGRGTTFAP